MQLSVVVTSYNRPEQFGATLRSLAEQTLPPDEILIADDCSPHDPSSVVESHRALFRQPLVYFRHERNIGMPANLNFLLDQAKGELIANCHDADQYAPDYLEQAVRALRRYPQAGMVFCGWKYTDPDRAPYVPHFPAYSEGREFYRRHLARKISCPIWGTVVFRREILARYGKPAPRFGPLADVDLWSQICLDYGVAYIEAPLLILYPIGTHGNDWRWERFDWGRQINAVNLRRHFGRQPGRYAWERFLHGLRYQQSFFVGMAHLAKRRAWARWFQGFKIWPRIWC